MAKAAPVTQTPAAKGGDEGSLDDKGVFSGKTGDDNDDDDDQDPPAGKPAAKSKANADKVKVTIGDQELETDAASAAVINSMLQMNQEMAAMIRNGYKTAAPEAKPAAKAEEFDYETELFTNPKGAIARLRAEITQEVETKLSGQYQADQSSKAFWGQFYSDNKELKEEKMIVNAVLQRDWAKLKDMDGPKAAKALAEATKKEIMRLSGGKSESDPDFREEEGGSNKGRQRKDPPKDDDEPKSLSDIVRARQAQRRNAQYRKTKE